MRSIAKEAGFVVDDQLRQTLQLVSTRRRRDATLIRFERFFQRCQALRQTGLQHPLLRCVEVDAAVIRQQVAQTIKRLL
jgi:hypothetical protein